VDLRSKWVEKRVTALEKEENERNVVVALSVSVGEELAINCERPRLDEKLVGRRNGLSLSTGFT
jgi:hypothetical protein